MDSRKLREIRISAPPHADDAKSADARKGQEPFILPHVRLILAIKNATTESICTRGHVGLVGRPCTLDTLNHFFEKYRVRLVVGKGTGEQIQNFEANVEF